MRFKTHIVFALFLFLLYSYFYELNIVGGLLCLFFSVLMDIDKYNSKLGKKVFPISLLLNMFGHRGFMHSVWVLLISILFGKYWIFVFLGLLSHLILDSLTPKGVRWFWPFSFEINGSFRTGSIFDRLLFLVFILSCVVLGFFVI